MKRRLHISLLLVAGLGLAVTACAPKGQFIAGTKISRTQQNQSVIERVEAYRAAVEEKDASGLLLMASRSYWEDSGTPTGEDDYGFAGLKSVLGTRFQMADSIRYSMRYMRIRYQNETSNQAMRAFVDVLVDASFTVPDAEGELIRTDKRDQNQFVLEWTGEKWMFVAGM